MDSRDDMPTWVKKWLEACKSGDVRACAKLLEYATSGGLDDETFIYWIEQGFMTACSHGRLELVSYLLSPTDMPSIQAHVDYQHQKGFKNACLNGHVDVVSFLLLSAQLTQHASANIDDDYPLRMACHQGHMAIVELLLGSKVLKEKCTINIHARRDEALRSACANGHLDVVRFLLTSKDIVQNSGREKGIDHANIHAKDDDAIKLAYSNGHTHVVNYLLNEYKMYLCASTRQYILR